MRGKVFRHTHAQDRSRITPAYAGKRLLTLRQVHGLRDHPRLCGEKFASSPFAYLSWGSPPPMRGKVPCRSKVSLYRRITPAYAGKRIQYQAGAMGLKDHPRLCGEKWRNAGNSWKPTGSPPPMRGKALKMNFSRGTNRITPAYAGKSRNR